MDGCISGIMLSAHIIISSFVNAGDKGTLFVVCVFVERERVKGERKGGESGWLAEEEVHLFINSSLVVVFLPTLLNNWIHTSSH